MKKFFNGFTLAEVLITLTIIGVIAALTIPNLMQKWSDHSDVVKLKSTYSILDNAFKMAIAENGPVEDWAWPKPNSSWDIENGEYFSEVLAKYLKVAKFCGKENGCFDNNYKFLRGDNMTAQPYLYAGKMVLSNGVSLYPHFGSTYMTSMDSHIFLDINGKKGPNRFGYDVFKFGISSRGLSPIGGYLGSSKKACTFGGVEGYDWDGASCYYWIHRHGNMDYKYRDVAAEW